MKLHARILCLLSIFRGKMYKSVPARAMTKLAVAMSYKLCSPTILLRKQVEKAYKDSFREKLTLEIEAGSEEGVIWLCTLHRELIIRVCSYLKRNTKVKDEIAEHCDPVIFKQLLENKCYKLEDLSVLINYIYSCMQKLCAPIRDKHLEASVKDLNDRIVECADGKKKFSELICDFIISCLLYTSPSPRDGT